MFAEQTQIIRFHFNAKKEKERKKEKNENDLHEGWMFLSINLCR